MVRLCFVVTTLTSTCVYFMLSFYTWRFYRQASQCRVTLFKKKYIIIKDIDILGRN